MKIIFAAFITVLSIAALISGRTFAGNINTDGINGLPLTVAKESIDSDKGVVLQNVATAMNSENFGYTPTDFQNSTSFQTIKLELDNGIWNVDSGLQGGGNILSLCSNLNELVAIYFSGSGTGQLLLRPVGILTSGVEYHLKTSSNPNSGPVCNGNLPTSGLLSTGNAIEVTIPNNMSNDITLKINTIPIDTASQRLATIEYQYSANIITWAEEKIDNNTDFTTLYNTGKRTSDTTVSIAVELKTCQLDYPVNNNTTVDDKDVFRLTITPSNVTGISGMYIDKNLSGMCDVDLSDGCQPDNDNAPTYWSCTWDPADIVTDTKYTVKIKVDGQTIIKEKTFVLDAELVFDGTTEAPFTSLNVDNTEAKARTVALVTELLTGTEAGKWKLRGTNIYVPIIKHSSSGSTQTTFKFQSKDNGKNANQLRILVLCNDGSTELFGDSGIFTITPGTPLFFTSTMLASQLNCSVDNINGYAAVINFTTGEEDLFGYVTIIDNGIVSRVPLSTKSGVDN